MEENLEASSLGVCLFYIKNSILAEDETLQVYSIFSIFQSWSMILVFVISAETASSLKYIAHNGRSIFRAISEIARNSIIILHQNLFDAFCFL